MSSTFIQQNPQRNYVATRHLNLQRELTPNLAVIVGYVGSRGVHQQFKVDDADMIILASPGYKNFDFSLHTNTRITERVDTQFRAEFFKC